MPPPWSSSPLIALKATLTSTSWALLPSTTHRLNTVLTLAVVCASAAPFFDGAVSSATTIQTPASPLPVFSTFQPAGTLPAPALLKGNGCAVLPPARTTAPVTSTTTIAGQYFIQHLTIICSAACGLALSI